MISRKPVRIAGKDFPRFNDRALRMIMRVTAKQLKGWGFQRPRGTLQTSIKETKIGDNHYGIKMIGYANAVDEGRRAGRRPPSGPHSKIGKWSGSADGGRRLSRFIGRHGTRPTHFIPSSMEMSRPKWEAQLQNHLDYYFKSGGRTL